jgi:excisionase family DNA binding protein
MSMDLMNMKELMGFLKVKRSTIYKLREEGLPVIHLGRVVRFDREEIIRWLKDRQQSSPPPRPSKRTKDVEIESIEEHSSRDPDEDVIL